MCVHHTKNYWRGLLRLEFEACGSVSGWIGKSGLDEGGNRPDQEGQQKHLSKEKLDWRGHLQHNSFWFFCSQCCSSNDRAGNGMHTCICREGSPHDVETSV